MWKQCFSVPLFTVAALAATASAAVTINVPADQPTISAAITAASPGDTIVVAPGTYTENVVLNKQLTLKGAKFGVDARGRVSGAPNSAVESVVTAVAGDVIQLVGGSAGSIIDGFALVGGGRQIESTSGPISTIEVRNNYVQSTGNVVVFLNDTGLDMTFHQNVFMGGTGTGEVFHCDTDAFHGFHFTSNQITRSGPPASTGFFVDGNHNIGMNGPRAPLFDQNEIWNMTTGMNCGTRAVGFATYSANNFHNNGGDGLQGGIQNSAITGNVFDSNGLVTGTGAGFTLTSFGNMGADRGAQFLTITLNTFTANARGLSFSNTQAPGTIATNVSHNNVIAGNTTGARYIGTETINCENNFWGASNGPSGDGSGSGDVVFGMSGGGQIDFTPWLERAPFLPAIEVGDGPRDVLLANLVGSSALDIATANSEGDTLTILQNDGLGDFSAPAVTVATGVNTGPSSIASGDLVAGGGTDLAVACTDSNQVKVVSNTGSFAVTSTIAMPAGTSRPVHVAVAAIDGTAPADVLVALEGDVIPGGVGGLALISNGGPATLLTAPGGGFGRVKQVACADLDGDGDQDVAAVRNAGFASVLTTTQLMLYENQAGSLVLNGTLNCALDPAGIAAHDMDGDGDRDLVVTMSSFVPFNSGGVVVFVNNGAAVLAPGNFTATAVAPTNMFPGDVACGDLVGDSIPGFISRQDVMAVNIGSGDFTKLIAFGGGTFADSINGGSGTNPIAVAMGELNGDFTPDFVVANFGSDDVGINIATVTALAQPFGTGCPGTGALVPSISGVGLPTYNNPAFGVMVSNAKPFSATLLILSLSLFPAPIGGGCTLYPGAPISIFTTFTNGSGQATVFFPIPAELDPFRGVSAYFQYAVFDPAGAYISTLAFSNALRIKLGH